MLRLLTFLLAVTISTTAIAQQNYFYPNSGSFNPSIPTPEQFLGYAIGAQHTRHDKIVAYFQKLDELSDRITTRIIGKTFEQREQITAVFTSPQNHARIEEIRKAHLAGQINGNTENIPLVIHLGYNVHGNEPSSSEAAMLTAYYIVASQSEEASKWMNEMVITMDPVINPDGRDRHSSWANMHKAEPPVADPLDREHTEIWPGGRFNHYWFDLNRDWFLGTFPETRNRINFFHHWRPYIQTDHHEMGTNSTFYFDPGEDASNNPIVPDYLYKTIYPLYAQYFANATDKIGSMYFTKEAYDKLYPGYGSSYINFYGGAGFLFEQASSRGHVQETNTIPITFAFTIRNQFTASLTTIRASLAEKAQLLKMRKLFYQTSKAQAAASPVKGYLFGDVKDATRTKAFVDMLLLHEIEVYESGKQFYVPTDQDNYIMVRSVFEKAITYIDSSFYDASAWSLVHAYNLPYTELKTPLPKINRVTSVKAPTFTVTKSNYVYVFELTDYNAHKAIHQLQKGGAIVQTAFRPFTAMIDNEKKNFGYGSIVVPVNQQRISVDSLYILMSSVSASTNIHVYSLGTGYSAGGVDMGSSYMRTLQKPEVAMIIGTGVAAPEAGEIWHLLDQRLQMPISKIDILNLGRTNLNRYNTLIMVSGNYGLIDKNLADKIKAWVQNGGTLITIKTGSEWAIRNGFTREKLVSVDSSRTATARQLYDNAVYIEGAKAMGGSIFKVDVDTTNPIGFGLHSKTLSWYRNGLTFLQSSSNPYSTVAQYTNDPLIGGYIHPTTLKKVKNSAAILVGAEGNGKVILFSDNPNFRGTWYGSNKVFLNALFFGGSISVPSVAGEE
ncbi:M14 family zinc carboxypeptidase [Lacibacter sp. MH-610]|uniref:M14 family zinc carboxypeptidase n=1 Tax=Lacibacter sp. MH-610 TaxID=3020883 RepID=UPI0038919085